MLRLMLPRYHKRVVIREYATFAWWSCQILVMQTNLPPSRIYKSREPAAWQAILFYRGTKLSDHERRLFAVRHSLLGAREGFLSVIPLDTSELPRRINQRRRRHSNQRQPQASAATMHSGGRREMVSSAVGSVACFPDKDLYEAQLALLWTACGGLL